LKKFKTYFLITTISLIVTIYLFEGYLNINSSLRQVSTKKKENILYKKNMKYDSRTKLKIYKDLKLKNKNVTVIISPSIFNDPQKKLHFLAGKSKSYTIGCNENGYYSSYTSDRFGFNNLDHLWDLKKIEYLIVGDSFAHGACVNRPKEISSVLQKISNKPAINLGYKANGPLSMLASLKEYSQMNFKNLIWLYFEGNDLAELSRELKTEILKNYYFMNNFNQNLASKQSYIDNQIDTILLRSIELEDQILSEANKNSIIKYKILKFIRLDKSKKKFKLIFSKKNLNITPIKEFKKVLISGKKIANKKNANFYFVYLPQYERYKNRIPKNQDKYDDIKKIVNELDIQFIDLHEEVFKKEKDPTNLFPFKMWGHYNELGYKKISERIYKNLSK